MVRGTATEWWRAQRTGVKRGTMLYVYGYQSGVVHNYRCGATGGMGGRRVSKDGTM